MGRVTWPTARDEVIRDRLPRGGVARAVVLWTFPTVVGDRVEMPDSWVDAAVRWVGDGLGQSDPLWASQELEQFQLPVGDARRLLTEKGLSAPTHLVAGDLETSLRACNVSFATEHTHMALAAGGPASSDVRLAEILTELVRAARGLAADVEYALISIDATFSGFSGDRPYYREAQLGAGDLIDAMCDEFVLDAFPYQILGPAHVRRLGGVPADAGLFDQGRVEVFLGDRLSWMPGSPRRPALQETGRRVLEPCLLHNAEDLRRRRWLPQPG